MHMSDRSTIFARLGRDRGGVALLEFAFSMPLVLFIGLYGMEVSNLAIMNQRVSQAALNLADNASRVGMDTGLPQIQLREFDINDVLAGTRVYGKSFKLAERARITLSALTHDGTTQRIHWQRCLGLKRGAAWQTHYGDASLTDGTDQTEANNGRPRPQGMGPAGQVVHAPPNSGVMFVEINYDYEPLIGVRWISSGATRLHYVASFIVRDRRDFSQIYNPGPAATRMTCDKFTS